jgi:hypothetical protein
MTKLAHYLSFYAIAPRKRKQQRFEFRLETGTSMEAMQVLKSKTLELRLRNVSMPSFAPYSISEMTFTDHNGEQQAIVSRSIIPCGAMVKL